MVMVASRGWRGVYLIMFCYYLVMRVPFTSVFGEFGFLVVGC